MDLTGVQTGVTHIGTEGFTAPPTMQTITMVDSIEDLITHTDRLDLHITIGIDTMHIIEDLDSPILPEIDGFILDLDQLTIAEIDKDTREETLTQQEVGPLRMHIVIDHLTQDLDHLQQTEVTHKDLETTLLLQEPEHTLLRNLEAETLILLDILETIRHHAAVVL